MTASKPQPSLAPRRASAAFMLAHPAHAIALGFGSGLSPLAPGTVGTLWGWMSFLVLMPWLSAAQMGLLIAGGALVGWWVTRSITRPLARALEFSARVTAGDLTVRTQPDGQDEAAQLLREMNHMSEHLASLVGHVRTAADSMATGSREIAAGKVGAEVLNRGQA